MSHDKANLRPTISLLHATRERPNMASICRARWLRSASSLTAIEHIFAIDSDDSISQEALSDLGPVIVDPPGGGCVRAWNMAAMRSRGDVLVQLSDDWVPPEGWDRLILDAIGDLSKPTVLRVSDGHRTDDLLCIAILTRARLEQQGSLFAPDYQGVYSDDEFSFRAYKDGTVTHAPHLVFTHAHPHYDSTIEFDQTYLIQNSEERKRKGLLTFAQRNPDAFGRWIHRGTHERHFRQAIELHDIQNQLLDALSEIDRLLRDGDKLRAEVEVWQKLWRKDTEQLRSDAGFLESELERWKIGVDNWNGRSWFSRAIHKLRLERRRLGGGT